ncbi:MAG: tetratricopeptide repeat protein [Pseudomonadota bacterium]
MALGASLAVATVGAQNSTLQEIQRAFRNGDAVAALQRLDREIEAAPRDPQLRFLKGVLLAESGRSAEAADIYLRLTQEFPELPEPHNNLAVLYAADGRLDEARAALETALRNDPGYATAHENLGDVYARLALRSYERAGTLGAELQRKLQLTRQLVLPARGS